MKNKILILVLSVMIIVATWFVIQEKEMTVENKNKPVTNTVPAKYPDEQIGLISQNEKGENVFISDKYGVVFTYPKIWNTNSIGTDYLELVNFMPDSQKGYLVNGKNKIGAGVSEKVGDDSGFQKVIKKDQIAIAGRISTRFEYEDTYGIKSIFIYTPILGLERKYFYIYIYGDPVNFHILDEIIKNIQWTK